MSADIFFENLDKFIAEFETRGYIEALIAVNEPEGDERLKLDRLLSILMTQL